MENINTHNIKLSYSFVNPILNGDKTFEVRENDRGYQKGDLVKFNVVGRNEKYLSYEEDKEKELIESKTYEITYVLSGWGINDRCVVFSFKEKSDEKEQLPQTEE